MINKKAGVCRLFYLKKTKGIIRPPILEEEIDF
ncbi:MAG: hypothetical protein KatS3mg034_0624 [Vicingaceae bacterium]|nr:MAG: hypothetical protein KatS3mg034_0624 [Vicingaceae bacterium]